MSKRQNTNKKNLTAAELTGVGAGIHESSVNYSDNVVMGSARGHGFAAEKANHLVDVFRGGLPKLLVVTMSRMVQIVLWTISSFRPSTAKPVPSALRSAFTTSSFGTSMQMDPPC